MSSMPMPSTHNPSLVLASILVAMLASYTALDLAGRVTAARGAARALWLGGGAIAMGLGIWSMHYTAMLAFHLPVPVLYHVPTVGASLLAAMLASAVALWVVSRSSMRLAQAARGSLAMGAGIAAMHYTGMAAMRLQGVSRWNPMLVVLSVIIAIVVSFVGLSLAFHHRDDNARHRIWRRLGSAGLMGAAIPSMHYTAMAAVRYEHGAASAAGTGAGISSLGIVAIIASTVLVLAVALVTAVVDRHMAAKNQALESRELELAQQQALLAQVVDANPNLIFVKDWDGRFVLANKAVAEIYGTTPEGLLGRTDADFNGNLEQVEHYLRCDREVMHSGQPLKVKEEAVTSPTGQTRWYQTVKVPLRGPAGDRQVLGVGTDITEHRHLGEQLRQAQKMEAVGRLAGGVAHDFNNILTGILVTAELMMAESATNGRLASDLAEIKRSAERAAMLTRQLLAFSRKQVLQPKQLDLNVVVGGMETMLRRLIGEHIQLSTVAASGLRAVLADPGQLEQVIMNLAINARDAMPAGGRLTIETGMQEIDSSLATMDGIVSPGRYVMLAVSDTGIGLSDHVKAHLFEPFFTTKGQGQGTGLGLATVYGIIRQSGGYIFAYSEPGHGTTFKIYLPELTTAAAVTADPPAAPARGGDETVLVVEDEDLVRRLACRVLAERGYKVIAAADGQEALDTVQRHQGNIDLLITDVVMPRVGGPELADRLRVQHPRTRVLYFSGYTDDAVVRHGILQEGVFFLQKPFTPEVLARRVREALAAKAEPVAGHAGTAPVAALNTIPASPSPPSPTADGSPRGVWVRASISSLARV